MAWAPLQARNLKKTLGFMRPDTLAEYAKQVGCSCNIVPSRTRFWHVEPHKPLQSIQKRHHSHIVTLPRRRSSTGRRRRICGAPSPTR